MVDYLLCHTDTGRIWQQLSGNTWAGRVGISTKTIAKNFSLPIVHNNIHTASTQNLFSKLSTFSYNLIRPVGSHVSVIAKTAIAIAVVGLVGVGNFQAAQTSSLASVNNASGIDNLTQQELAVFVADLAGIESVKQQNIPSTLEQISYDPQSQNVVKAQIIKTDAETRHDITEHVVTQGETLASIAEAYGLKKQTIKWANDMSSETVALNSKLVIPPIDGVIHTVGEGETVADLADTFKANEYDIITFNDAELSGLKKGMKIVIPGGEKPAPEPVQTYIANNVTTSANYRSGYSTSNYTFLGRYTSGIYKSYFEGWCTAWAARRADQLGNPVQEGWGDAIYWDSNAAADNYYVGPNPKVGAVFQSDSGYAGHVGVVEAVSSDGSMIKYSDMNGLAGWGNAAKTNEWVPAAGYDYIYR